ncbi:MAG: phage baseplate protein [Myxococcota bacterium]
MRVTIQTATESIEVDATMADRHSGSVELTKHPIESGVSPVDHARPQPARLVLDGFFSSTSPNRSEQDRRGGDTIPGSSGWARQQADKLMQVLEARKTVVIETPVARHADMMLISLEIPRDSRSGDGVRFSATFEKVRFVSTERVKLQPVPRDRKKHGKKDEQPKKPPVPVDDEKLKEENRSLLKQGFDRFNILGSTPGSGA